MLNGKSTSISSDVSSDLIDDMVGSIGKSSLQDTKNIETNECESNPNSFKYANSQSYFMVLLNNDSVKIIANTSNE